MLELGNIYGVYLVINATRFSKSSEVREIGRLLMQMGGFPNQVPSVLSGILISYKNAEKKYSEAQMKVATQLTFARRPIFESYLDSLALPSGKNFHRLWNEATGGTLDNVEDRRVMYHELRRCGPEFIDWVFSIMIVIKKADYSTIELFKRIVDFGCKRDHHSLTLLLREIENDDRKKYLNIPYPCHMRLQRYLEAKLGRHMNKDEKEILQFISNESNIENIIFKISQIKAEEFSLCKLRFELMNYEDQISLLAMMDKEDDPLELMKIEDPFDHLQMELDRLECEAEDNEMFPAFSKNTPDYSCYDYSNYDSDSLESDDYLGEMFEGEDE